MPFPSPPQTIPSACCPLVWAPGLQGKCGDSQPSSGGEHPVGGQQLQCQSSPEHRLVYQLGQDFSKCQNHRKASAGASLLATICKGAGNQPLWVLTFAVLTARSVQSALIFWPMLHGLDFNPQGDFIIAWYPTPISKLYIRVGAVTHLRFYSRFLVCRIFTAYGSRSWKKSICILGKWLPLSRISGKLCILENACPLVRNSLPGGWKFWSKRVEISPLRRSKGAWKSKAVWTYLQTTISMVPAASRLQQRGWKYKCKPVPSHPTLPGTLPKPALFHSSWLIAILNPSKGSDLLFCRHVPKRVLRVGTDGKWV